MIHSSWYDVLHLSKQIHSLHLIPYHLLTNGIFYRENVWKTKSQNGAWSCKTIDGLQWFWNDIVSLNKFRTKFLYACCSSHKFIVLGYSLNKLNCQVALIQLVAQCIIFCWVITLCLHGIENLWKFICWFKSAPARNLSNVLFYFDHSIVNN